MAENPLYYCVLKKLYKKDLFQLVICMFRFVVSSIKICSLYFMVSFVFWNTYVLKVYN